MKSYQPKYATNERGLGSIYFIQKRNCYAGAITLEINGRKKRKTVYGKSKLEVHDKLLDLQIKAKTGELVDRDLTTVYQLAKKMIEEQFALNEIKESSYERKLETLKKLEPICNIPIQDLTIDQIKRFFMTQMNYSQSTINKLYQLLNSVLNEAKLEKIITDNPMRRFKRPKSKKTQVKVRGLTIDEQKNLLYVLKNKEIVHGEQMLIAMFTGMRMGEINALEVKDIDFRNRCIHVTKTVSRGSIGEALINNRPKTEAGMRKVPINDEMILFLKGCLIGKESGLIFTNHGSIITTNMVNNVYVRTLEKYNIIDNTVYGKVNLHSLRHTFASRCIESGMPPKVLQKILGHTDISITLNTYTDVFDSFMNDKLTVTDQYLNNVGLSIL